MKYSKYAFGSGGGIKLITMIAVGVGIAPMIHTLRAIFKHRELQLKTSGDRAEHPQCFNSESSLVTSSDLKIKVNLLYGVVSVISTQCFMFVRRCTDLLYRRLLFRYLARSCRYLTERAA